MSQELTEPGEGNSPAAWTAVTVMIFAFILGTFAFVLGIEWLLWSSVVLLFVGWGLGFLLSSLGFGVNGPRYTPKHHQ